MNNNRRNFIKKSASMAAAISVVGLSSCSGTGGKETQKGNQKQVEWPLSEGPSTPKLVMSASRNSDDKAIRRIKQLGINYVNSGYGGPGPWEEAKLRDTMDYLKGKGLTVLNMMHQVGINTILGREGRDAEIALFQESLSAAGAAGLPNVEYNWYVDRLVEGYEEVEGRGGSGVTGYDYSKVKDIPAKPEIGIHKAEEIWENITYFLKKVIPVAEKAGVRMALHPNDPVAQVAHQSDQIMANVAGWKRLISIVDSPSNGITFDPGVTKEMGEDPVEVCRYFASRDRINHMHFRNVITEIPYDKYTEVFIDEGQANLFAVMQEVMKHGYNRALLPEHPHILDYDRDNSERPLDGGVAGGGGGGGYAANVFNIAFTRALMWSVMSSQ
jgi:mannonate dehydratase